MKKSFKKLENSIINCKKCPRLVNFRTQVAKDKRKQYINEKYWGKPITGFGDRKARILFVGLAPAAHGGNRTGRVFTGDRSSEFLYKNSINYSRDKNKIKIWENKEIKDDIFFNFENIYYILDTISFNEFKSP